MNATWSEDGLTFHELIRQPYTNCVFSAGSVEGHPVDTLYLRWERHDEGRMLLLRPDEAAALAWCVTGVLWSTLVEEPQHDAHAIALAQTCGCLLVVVTACVVAAGLAMLLRVVLGV